MLKLGRKLILFVLFLTNCQPVFADDIKLCRSPYALMHKNFNYGAYKSSLRKVHKYTVVTLWHTFGDDAGNYAKELASPQVVGTELALYNETCVTRGDCGRYEFLAGYTTKSLKKAIDSNSPKLRAKLDDGARSAAGFLTHFLRADQTCQINPFLETHLDPARIRKVWGWVGHYFETRCSLVWNPNGSTPGPVPQGFDISEAHGPSPRFAPGRCIANPDGSLIPIPAYQSYLTTWGQHCDFACTWGLNDNCNSTKAPRTDPRLRSCRGTSDFPILAKAMERAQK